MKNFKALQNTVITIIYNTINEDGDIQIKKTEKHLSVGTIYEIENFAKNKNGSYNLHFKDSGVAAEVDSGAIRILGRKPMPRNSSGCGSCGKK